MRHAACCWCVAVLQIGCLLHAQVLAMLFQRGADMNAQDEDGQTPLQYANLCEQVRRPSHRECQSLVHVMAGC